MDPNGALFNDMVRFYKLSIANNLQDDPTTFCDLKTGTKRALDLVITTTIEKITREGNETKRQLYETA